MDAKIKQLLEKALTKADVTNARGTSLVDDAVRLCGRVHAFMHMKILPAEIDLAPLEIACYALQFPLKQQKMLPTGKLGRSNLKDRAEQAAEILVAGFAREIDGPLLDRTTQLLQALPQRNPPMDEARLLADVVNLDDFGITGLLLQTVMLSRAGGSVTQVGDGLEKREQYGYWGARLKEGFHFEPIREIARRRLEHTRQAAALLSDEIKEDRGV